MIRNLNSSFLSNEVVKTDEEVSVKGLFFYDLLQLPRGRIPLSSKVLLYVVVLFLYRARFESYT